jgi:hypothetical protein
MATEHNTLTDPELHEPKGVASATANQMYLADGAGSGDWRNFPHSHMYYSDIGTGTTITTPTAYTVINPTTVGDTDPHDFSHSGAGKLTYTGTDTVDASIAVTLTIKHSTGSGVDCYFAVYKNGAAIAGGEHVHTADSANYGNVVLIVHTELVTSDYIEIYCKAASGNIVVHAMNVDIDGRP